MKNGIVILNYNDSENTSLILEEIQHFKVLDKIVVVDNKSSDRSLEKLKAYENEKIILLSAKENKGYAAGNNIGIRYLIEQGIDHIIISNPDILVEEKAIEKLIEDLKKEDISLIAPVIKEPLGDSKGWRLPTFFSELLSNIPFFRRFESSVLKYKEEMYSEYFTQVDVVKGCFFIIKADVFLEIGLFDEHTFLYYEENIIGKKLKEKGYKTFVDNQVSVIHALSQSVNKSVKKIEKFKLLKKSQFYYDQYVASMNLLQLIILRMFYYFYLTCLEIVSIRKG